MNHSQKVVSQARRTCPGCKTEQIIAATAAPEIVHCQQCGMAMGSTSSPRSLAKPLIAIIGTEGSGKTVLTTTLAKRLSAEDSPNLRMHPQGARTLKYVERVWQTLQSEQWPSSTAPGELFELNWRLETAGAFDGEIRLIDAAGQDMRLLFGNDEIQSIESLPSHLRPLAEYCRGADIFLFLVNLKDFIGHADAERKIVNEAFLNSALDHAAASGRPKRICLVLTQADQYLPFAKKCGGWEKLVSHYIPNAFKAHIRDKPVNLIPVAAVAETTMAAGKGQKPRRVPKQGFKSAGLDKLIAWLITQIEDAKREFDKETETAVVPAREQADLQVVTSQPLQPQTDFWQEFPNEIRKLIGGKERMASLIAAILLGGGCWLGSTILGRANGPVAVFLKKQNRDVRGIFDDGVEAFGTIRNDGTSGKIRVWTRVIENGTEVERKYSDFYLNHGESANYYFSLNNLRDVSNRHSLDTWSEIP